MPEEEPFDKDATRAKIRESLGVPPIAKPPSVEEPEPEVDSEEIETEVETEEEEIEEIEEIEEPEDEEEEPEVEEEEESELEDEPNDSDDLDDDDLDLDLDNDEEEPEAVDLENPTKEEKENAVKRLITVGRENTSLKKKLQLAEEQLVERETKIKETEEQLEKFTLTKIDPTSHPDFVSIKQETGDAIFDSVLDTIGKTAAQKIDPQWGNLLTETNDYKAAKREDKPAALDKLRLNIAKTLGLVGDTHTKLDPDIDEDAIDAAKKVTSILVGSVGSYKKMAKIYSDIQNRAEDKTLEIGHSEYQTSTATVRERLAAIDTLSEKDIDDDPDSLQSLAARKIQSSPEAATKAKKIDKYLVEMAFGPEALSQEELNRHAESGKDMTEFHKTREKRVRDFREKRIPEIKAMMVLLPQIKKALPELFKTETEEESRKAKKAAVRSAKTKTKSKTEVAKDAPKTKDQMKEDLRRTLMG